MLIPSICPPASPPCLRFEKASLVAKLRAARERKVAAGGRGSGRFPYAQKVPEVVALARELHGQRQSLRQMSKTPAARWRAERLKKSPASGGAE